MFPEIQVRVPQDVSEIGDFIAICANSGNHNVIPPMEPHPDYLHLLATRRDEVLGGSLWQIEGRVAELQDNVVEPKSQGQGIMSLLLTESMRLLEGLGVRALKVIPDEQDELWYAKMGFRAESTYGPFVRYL